MCTHLADELSAKRELHGVRRQKVWETRQQHSFSRNKEKAGGDETNTFTYMKIFIHNNEFMAYL